MKCNKDMILPVAMIFLGISYFIQAFFSGDFISGFAAGVFAGLSVGLNVYYLIVSFGKK